MTEREIKMAVIDKANKIAEVLHKGKEIEIERISNKIVITEKTKRKIT